MNIETLATQAEQILQAYQAGDIGIDEYRELVANLNLIEAVNDSTASLEQNIGYRQAILVAVRAAGMLI